MDKVSITAFVSAINGLNFVKDARFDTPRRINEEGFYGVLKIRTPKGTYSFTVKTRTSYLDRSLLNAFISKAQTKMKSRRERVLLFARYVPRPSAEKLIQAGVNFVDLAGNMHLAVDKEYVRTVLGNKEVRAHSDRILTPARIQLLFALAAHPEAADWPVRQLSELAGIGKSNAAKLRQQLLSEGLLHSSKKGFIIRDMNELEQELLRGYERVLRPRLLIGRFRAQESAQPAFIEKLKSVFKDSSTEWSLTGGPAASLLQHFYKGTEVPVFISALLDEAKRELRILPDQIGPIIFLRSFGRLARWKHVRGVDIANPWLVFAELMQSEDPRAHEAAIQLKEEFLRAA